jgi:hypothetical protein
LERHWPLIFNFEICNFIYGGKDYAVICSSNDILIATQIALYYYITLESDLLISKQAWILGYHNYSATLIQQAIMFSDEIVTHKSQSGGRATSHEDWLKIKTLISWHTDRADPNILPQMLS